VTVSLRVERDAAAISVDDTGQGIASEDLKSIFEPFWRGRESSEGFGIGLALVRGIVELHNGEIGAFSGGRGQGARFRMTVPITAKE
jgi:signal transduction histidine kinase